MKIYLEIKNKEKFYISGVDTPIVGQTGIQNLTD